MATSDEQPPVHILFFPFLAPGHLIPIGDMAALFAARGARCTILTTPVNAAIIRPAVDRANDANSYGAAIKISVVPFPDVGLPPGVENGTGLTDQADRDNFFRAIQLLREPFDRFLADKHNHPVDAVVADSHFQWSVEAAAEHGVPRIAFLGTSMFARACTDVMLRKNPMESSCPEQDDPDAMVALPGLPHRVELRRSQMPDPRKQPQVIAFFKVVNEEDQRSFGEVFNSFHELEPEYVEHYQTTLGRRVWLVGPVARPDMDTRGSALSPEADGCLRWLDAKPADSVVYVSFGTLSNFSPDELRELAGGLSLSGKNFVWVISGACTDDAAAPEWMPEGFAELLASGERGLVIRGWAPQVVILNHPALGGFLTHCGWNSVLEAVSAGVPMVTWPRYADQFFNEKLVVEVLKVGASVGARDYASAIETHRLIGAEVIAESIGRVMDGGGGTIRSNAKELGAKARGAVEKGGSSYGDIGRLMDELMARRS
jgi:UDP:flavonoid glycosyltransferase YjiC (YdhE family)